MKKYLDPVYLAISEDVWMSRIYAEIFDSLNESLNYIEEVEKSSDALYKLVIFKFSQNLFGEIYNHNPFKNEPKVQGFYLNTFNRVLSDLARRFDWCPGNCKTDGDSVSQAFSCESSYVPNKVISAWMMLINQCAICSQIEPLLFLSPTSFETNIEVNSNTFDNLSFIQATSVYQLFSVDSFLKKETINENSLRKAVDILYSQAVLAGRMAPEKQPQDYAFHSNFWRTIENAKLTEEDTQYKQRFIDSLTQVVYAIDIDIRLHKYGKISINRKKYDKYSADVFQMGRGTNDRRCSIIFFCKINNQICFYEFDPDFHAGE
jgi:hypothetical protein